MLEPTSNKHYETKFIFRLWKLIKQRAEEKDISYVDAAKEVVPEYVKTIRYRDTDFAEDEVHKRAREIAGLVHHETTGKDIF
jgi:hypothetical protein